MNKLSLSEKMEFEVKSGSLRVTDPCYDVDTRYATSLKDVVNGKWSTFSVYEDCGDWGKRVKSLHIYSTKESPIDLDKLKNEEFDGYILSYEAIGVDSGQAGFFDLDWWLNMRKGDEASFKTFYDEACSLTYQEGVENHPQFGTTPNYVVSSTGYGDGVYALYCRLNGYNEIVEAFILFIQSDEDEDKGA